MYLTYQWSFRSKQFAVQYVPDPEQPSCISKLKSFYGVMLTGIYYQLQININANNDKMLKHGSRKLCHFYHTFSSYFIYIILIYAASLTNTYSNIFRQAFDYNANTLIHTYIDCVLKMFFFVFVRL